MRIAFFVNSIEGETPNYSTTHLALAALNRGHDICYVTPADFVLRPDDTLAVRAMTLPSKRYKKAEGLNGNGNPDVEKVFEKAGERWEHNPVFSKSIPVLSRDALVKITKILIVNLRLLHAG